MVSIHVPVPDQHPPTAASIADPMHHVFNLLHHKACCGGAEIADKAPCLYQENGLGRPRRVPVEGNPQRHLASFGRESLCAGVCPGTQLTSQEGKRLFICNREGCCPPLQSDE